MTSRELQDRIGELEARLGEAANDLRACQKRVWELLQEKAALEAQAASEAQEAVLPAQYRFTKLQRRICRSCGRKRMCRGPWWNCLECLEGSRNDERAPGYPRTP